MAFIEKGNRGGSVLVYGNFRYHKNRKSDESIFWRCWRKECRAPLKTNIFQGENPDIVVLQEGEHNHEEDSDVVAAGRLARTIEEKIQDNPSKPVKRIYNRVVIEADDIPDDDIPDFHRLRSRLQRTRASFLPPVPHNVDDVVVDGEWERTWNGQQFKCHQDNDWGILVFATRGNFERLQRCATVYIDGTFKTCPHPYVQFVTVHGLVIDRVIPLVSCLMTGKQVGQYRQLLQVIKRRVRDFTRHRFRPQQIICDFEVAIISAIETELPGTTISGCYFHFCQSLWRRVQELGLSRQYNRSRRLRKLLRKLFALGYLPLPLVRPNFQLLINDNRTQRLIRRFPALQDFIRYLTRNYLNAQGSFPPRMWNVFNRDTDTRTNNHIEGFHQRWNSAVGTRHPSIWIFIRKLKDEQKLGQLSAAAGQRGEPAVPRKKKSADLQRRITRLKAQYNGGQRPLVNYWEAVAHAVRTGR